MQTNDLTAARLRQLADLKPDNARVLSLFLNLDPRDLATPPARASEVRSVLDQADRAIKEAIDANGITHDEAKALREDLQKATDFFNNGSFDAKGAHGLAVYLAGPAGLFDVIKLPRPVATNVVVDDSPFIEPIADLGSRTRWMVVLVSSRNGRILRGTADSLREVDQHWDDVHGRHSQGGWSQARYQRSVQEEKKDHLRATADVVFEYHKRAPVDRLLVGCTEEIFPAVKGALHSYLSERLVGRFDVDVENASTEDVFKLASKQMEEFEQSAEHDLIARLREGVGSGGRAVAGLDETLGALNERRVEKLVVNHGFVAAGAVCPQDGTLYPAGTATCPADGTKTDQRDDVIESAIELALAQSAHVRVVRYHGIEIEALGQIGAILRF
jgi:peptide subunit release factor 1 (eRF1)